MLRDCWSDYRHARQSPLWAESYFRCQQLTVFYECGELKQAACIKEEPNYRQISLEIFERVKEACNGNVYNNKLLARLFGALIGLINQN